MTVFKYSEGMFTEKWCEQCLKEFRPNDFVAEMYNEDGDGSEIVHVACGRSMGMEEV
jgi:hypothetical protein